MDIISYSLSKKIAASAVSGVSSMSVDGTTLNIDTNDGQRLQMVFPQPKDGVSVTDIDVNANNQIVFTMSDGSEFISGKIPTVKGDKGDPFKYSDFTTEQLDALKGKNGVSPTITENADNTDKIYRLDITTADSTFTTPNLKGKDGSGSSTGEENVIESIKVNGVVQTVADDKSVDITVPTVDVDKNYVDTELAKKANTSDIPSLDGYVTDTELSAKGYLTEHQDISGKVDKVDGKSLIADTEIERLASVDNYDDTQVKTQIQAVANGLMDSVGYSADYKTIDIIAKNGVKKSVNVAPIISHASITELSDVDTTNKATGKALVYNATTSKHEYADVSGTDEKVKMDASTDAKYLGELLDNVTIANENGELKVKKLDGQEVTITEINYLKGLTMNVMDLVNMFSNGGVKIINTPVATYAELLTLDKSSFIEGVSYLVYVLADENHDNAKTTYLVDKDSEIPTYFGFADSQRDFTTNPIDLATEITGKLGIANMDSDAIKALFTVDDTYKTETATNNAFSTHGAKALYDELLLAIGNKANSSDLTAHKDDADIHVSTEDRTKWDSAKTHADSAHAPSNAQANVLETVKVNNQEITPDENKAVNIDLSDYAKKTDIPTTLPANGGNSDTVNNHTVETDVPTDAVFTDTVYDDTEVKGSIEELSSNLTDLAYGDIAGGKNLIKNVSDVYRGADSFEETTLDGYNCVRFTSGVSVKNPTIPFKSNTQYTVSFMLKLVEKSADGVQECAIAFFYTDGTFKQVIVARSEYANWRRVVATSDAGKTIDTIGVNSVDYRTYCYVRDFQLEEGTSASEYVPYIMSNKQLGALNESLSVIGKCKNLLNTTLQTTTQNGVTCTNNGDGTYTLNGTASSDTYFVFENITKFEDGKYKIVGSKDQNLYCNVLRRLDDVMEYSKLQEKYIPTAYLSNDVYKLIQIGIVVISGTTLTNEIVKPMLTTNLSATYDDFVPYTGDGETLASDVAEIRKDLNGSLKSKILMELTVSEYGAVCLGLETDCIIDAVMLPVNNYIIIPFNVPPLWYGIICQNTPKYPIVTGVTIPEGTKVYYHSIN